MEEFVAAEDDDARLDEAEAGADVPGDELKPVRLGELAGLQHLREPVHLGFVLAGDQHRADLADATASSSSRTRWTLPLNRSTDSTRRWTDASTLGRGSAETTTFGQLHEVARTPLGGEQPGRVGDPFEEVLRLLLQVAAARPAATHEPAGR